MSCMLFIYLRSLQALYCLFGGALCYILTEILKRLIRQPRPTKTENRDYGMPSSHSQVSAFIATYSNLESIMIKPDLSVKTVLIIGNTLTLFILWSRIRLGHHSFEQVTVGTIIGVILGFVWNGLWHSGYFEDYNNILFI